MRFRIEYAPATIAHLKDLTARQQSIVLDGAARYLSVDPLVETRSHKPMRPNPLAPWELRLGHLRVYFDVVIEPEPVVVVLAVASSNETRFGSERRSSTCEDSGTPKRRRVRRDLCRRCEEGPVIFTVKGDPVAALVRVTSADLETLSLGSSRKFLRTIARSRAAWKTKGGLSAGEVRRRLSRPAKKRQPPS